ncbi:MAG: AAA family ATPase [Pseudomonadota bacterium]
MEGEAVRSEDGAGDGLFIAVVGPSGAGKDSLIRGAAEALRHDPRFVFPRRWITRPPDETEPAEEITRAEWARRRADGKTLLAWDAHGLGYAIPDTVRADIGAGRIVIANVSRAVLHDLPPDMPPCAIVHVTASEATLARRLAARGREDAEGRARRLKRRVPGLPETLPVRTVSNDGTREAGVAAMIAALHALAGLSNEPASG